MPSLALDPYTDEILADPFEFYRLVREAGPVVHVDQREGFDLVAVGRDSVTRAVLEDPVTFISSRGNGVYDIARGEHFREPALLVENDPPEHTAIRAVMTEVLSPRNTRRLRADFQVAADEIVERLLDLRTFDAQHEVAEAFPLRVVPDLVMGSPREGRENLLKYSVFLFESMGPRTPRTVAVLEALGDIEQAAAWVAASCARENVAPGSLGSLIWACVDRAEVRTEHASNLVRSLVGAGIDTTIHSLANTVELLVRHPDQWQLLREQPARAKFAYEEALRVEPTVRQTFRTPARDTEIEGVAVAEGQKIMLLVAAANRDEQRWGRTADEFDLTRNASGHLTFGRGIHACVGAMIARLEADVLLSTFARRVRAVEFAGTPVRMLNNSLRGWASLPVTVSPA